MPMIHYAQSDFRKGRIGDRMRVRQDTQAYQSSLRDAENMMVLADGTIARRWGTLIEQALTADTRLIAWDYAAGETTQFLLLFSAGELRILDLTGAERALFSSQPWTAEGVRFLQASFERNQVVVTDQSFRTRLVALDTATGLFSISSFAFALSSDETRLRAPFYQFEGDDLILTPRIFTAAGQSTGYAAHIATATGFASGTDFDLAAGTGKITANRAFFVAGHVGSRLRLLGGEVEVTAVTSGTEATIKVWRDIAIRLENNPFFLRSGSNLVEVAQFDHGLKQGDQVYFVGLSKATGDQSTTVLTKAVAQATSTTAAPAPAATPAPYTVQRVIDADHYEIVGQANATNDILSGGSDVYVIPLSGIRRPLEPVFSDLRGWPQASTFHERRLWLGGTSVLPNAIWASQFFDPTNFDTGEGNPTDAIQLYGLGQQARVRHMVSAFDLIVLTDTEEIYIPGNTDTPITQESARGVTTTSHGAAFTTPARFDGGVVFVDAVGQHVREMITASREQEYTAPPLTVGVPEWVKGPDEAAIYQGAPLEATPYLIFTNSGDGSALVMHSSRQDDAFGFMRWTLGEGSFRSFAGIGSRLYAVGERGGSFFLLRFDTGREDFTTTDFAAELTADPATTAWVSTAHADRTVQIHNGAVVYSDVTVGADGSFVTPEAVTRIALGDPMPWRTNFHPPVAASGQGPKAGKIQRLVSVEIHWLDTETGLVDGQSALSALDGSLFGGVTAINEWREYHIGKWDREPFLSIYGETPGRVGVRAVTSNVHF